MPRPATAFAQLDQLQPIMAQEDIDRRAERYFFFAGDEPGREVKGKSPGGLLTQSACVPGLEISRCRVTPCLTTGRWNRVVEIIEGSMIPNSQHTRPGLAQEWLFAGQEAQHLLDSYGNAADTGRQWGLVELKSLRGMDWRYVLNELKITELFFPKWPDIPETNQGVFSDVTNTLDLIKADKCPRFKFDGSDEHKKRKKIYVQVADDMFRSIDQAQLRQMNIIRAANIAVTLPSTDPSFKDRFEDGDYLYAKRTGIELAVNALRQNKSTEMERLVDTLVAKLQPNVAIDPNLIASIVTATLQALNPEQTTKKAKDGNNNQQSPKDSATS